MTTTCTTRCDGPDCTAELHPGTMGAWSHVTIEVPTRPPHRADACSLRCLAALLDAARAALAHRLPPEDR